VNKTLKQLREERQVSLDEMTALINVAEAEDRNLTEDEQSTFDATEKNVNDLASRIDRLERSLELAKNNPVSFGTQDIAKTDKDLKRFSFGAVAKAAYTGVLDGIVKEMDAEARLEAPGQLYRGVAVPSIALQTRDALGEQAGIEVGSFVDQLEANSVLAQAGANF
jgi:HK97 family phage major capsid protein